MGHGSRVVAVRGVEGDSFQACFLQAVQAANKGLDLLTINGVSARVPDDVTQERIVWVDEPEGVHLLVACFTNFMMPILNAGVRIAGR